VRSGAAPYLGEHEQMLATMQQAKSESRKAFILLPNVCDDLPGTGGATDAGEAHSIWRDNGVGLGQSLCSHFCSLLPWRRVAIHEFLLLLGGDHLSLAPD